MLKKKPLKAQAKKKRRQGGKGKPFPPGNEWRWPPGKSGNAGGRPRMSETYAEWLALEDPKTKLTNAQLVVSHVGAAALAGDVGAAREIRQSVDGDRVQVGPSILINMDQ